MQNIEMQTFDYIVIAALAVSACAVYKARSRSKRGESSRQDLQSAQSTAQRRRLLDQIIVETHGLWGDVRLHVGALEKARARAKAREAESGLRDSSGLEAVWQIRDAEPFEAEKIYEDCAQPVLGVDPCMLMQRSVEDLEFMLQDLKSSRGQVQLLTKEADELLSD